MNNLFQLAANKLNLLRNGILGVRITKTKEGMRCTRVNIEEPCIASCQPTCMHEQAVIQECVPGTHGEKRWAQVLKIAIKRRNIGVTQVLFSR